MTFKRLLIAFAILALWPDFSAGAICGELRKSTAKTIVFGPIVDGTDGKTFETALHNDAAHIELSKNGADYAAKNDATATVHIARGQYHVVLDATDTGTLGLLRVDWADANDVIIIPQDYLVLDPNAWDAKYSTGEVDAYSIQGSKTAAVNLKTVYANTLANYFDDVNDLFNARVKAVSKSAGVMSTGDVRAAVRFQQEAAIAADANDNSQAANSEDMMRMLSADPPTTINTVTDEGEFTITAGSAVNDWYNQAMIVVQDVSDGNRRAVRLIRDYTGASKTVKTDQFFPFLPAAADPVYIYNVRAVGRGRVSP